MASFAPPSSVFAASSSSMDTTKTADSLHVVRVVLVPMRQLSNGELAMMLSYLDMIQQFQLVRVNRGFKHLLETHPLLLSHIDLTPVRLGNTPVTAILHKISPARVRNLSLSASIWRTPAAAALNRAAPQTQQQLDTLQTMVWNDLRVWQSWMIQHDDALSSLQSIRLYGCWSAIPYLPSIVRRLRHHDAHITLMDCDCLWSPEPSNLWLDSFNPYAVTDTAVAQIAVSSRVRCHVLHTGACDTCGDTWLDTTTGRTHAFTRPHVRICRGCAKRFCLRSCIAVNRAWLPCRHGCGHCRTMTCRACAPTHACERCQQVVQPSS